MSDISKKQLFNIIKELMELFLKQWLNFVHTIRLDCQAAR